MCEKLESKCDDSPWTGKILKSGVITDYLKKLIDKIIFNKMTAVTPISYADNGSNVLKYQD